MSASSSSLYGPPAPSVPIFLNTPPNPFHPQPSSLPEEGERQLRQHYQQDVGADPRPAAKKSSTKMWALLAVVAGVLLLLGFLVWWLIFGRTTGLFRPPESRDPNHQISIDEALPHMKTGDLLLFSSSDFPLLKIAFRTPWSHVAMVVRDPYSGQLYSWECLPRKTDINTRRIPDLLTQTFTKEGVQMMPLEQRLREYQGYVAWRPLQVPTFASPYASADTYSRLYEYIQRVSPNGNFDYGTTSLLWPNLIAHHLTTINKTHTDRPVHDEDAPKWFLDHGSMLPFSNGLALCSNEELAEFLRGAAAADWEHLSAQQQQCKRGGVFCSELLADTLFFLGIFRKCHERPNAADNWSATFAPARFAMNNLPTPADGSCWYSPSLFYLK
jgi:hypothetical protein